MRIEQSQAVILKMGPFVDETDGVTAKTGLTVAQADIQISKNGGAFAQTSDASPTTTHDADGWYPIPLTATDTNTLGHITVQVTMSGALPVWREYEVCPADVYGTMIQGDDALPAQVEGMDANVLTASALATDAVNEIVDQVWREPIADHSATANSVAEFIESIDSQVASTLADTNELQTDWANGGRLDLLVDQILADTGELQTDWADGGRLDAIVDLILADTNELQGDWTNGGRLDLIIDAVLTDTADMQPKIGTPVALDGGAATVGAMLTKIADDNGGADFDATTDSLEKQQAGSGATAQEVWEYATRVLTAGTNLENLSQAEAQAAAQAAIVANDLDHLVKVAAPGAPATPPVSGSFLGGLEVDNGEFRWTSDALAQAPSGGSTYIIWGTANQNEDNGIVWEAWCLLNNVPQTGATNMNLKLYVCDEDGTESAVSGAEETDSTPDGTTGLFSGKITQALTAGKLYVFYCTCTAGGSTRYGKIPVMVPVRTQ